MKLIISTAAAALLSTSAFAADAVFSYDPVPSVAQAPAFNWSGAYIGVNLGYGGGEFKHPFAVSQTVSGSLDISSGGFLGGVQAGYNWQSGSFVYGVEADFQGSAIDGTVAVGLSNPNGPETISGELGTEVEWFGTIRARAGVAATESLLAYVTGGAAYGRTNSSASYSYFDGTTTSSGTIGAKNTDWGWTVGAGVEYAVTNNFTLKTEYLYTDLGKATLYSAPGVSLQNDVAFHTVRVGLNYKF